MDVYILRSGYLAGSTSAPIGLWTKRQISHYVFGFQPKKHHLISMERCWKLSDFSFTVSGPGTALQRWRQWWASLRLWAQDEPSQALQPLLTDWGLQPTPQPGSFLWSYKKCDFMRNLFNKGTPKVLVPFDNPTSNVLSGPKSAFGFLSKNKRHFSFSPRTLLNNIFTLLFHYFLPFFRQLHNFIFPKLFIFFSKELFQVPFTVFQGIETFSIKRIL